MSSETQSIAEDAELRGAPAGVHASVVVPAPPVRVWEHLISPRGTETLLGEGVRLGRKGESWHAADGSFGVVRSYHSMEQIRVTWHPNVEGPRTLLDLQLRPEGDGTRVDVSHEGPGIAENGPGRQRHWEDALGRIAEQLSG